MIVERLPLPRAADLRRIALFSELSIADLDRILPTLCARSFRRGSTLILRDDFQRRVCFVWSGSYRLVIAAPPRKIVLVRYLKRGGSFGHLPAISDANLDEQMRIACDEDGLVLEMDAEQFAGFRREMPALEEAILVALSAIAADQASRIFELLTLSARERVQAELLRLARAGDWQGKCSIVRPAPTRQVLADQVGATREGVTRILSALADESLIRVDRGVIEVLDIDRLLALDEAATGRRMFDLTKATDLEDQR